VSLKSAITYRNRDRRVLSSIHPSSKPSCANTEYVEKCVLVTSVCAFVFWKKINK